PQSRAFNIHKLYGNANTLALALNAAVQNGINFQLASSLHGAGVLSRVFEDRARRANVDLPDIAQSCYKSVWNAQFPRFVALVSAYSLERQHRYRTDSRTHRQLTRSIRTPKVAIPEDHACEQQHAR